MKRFVWIMPVLMAFTIAFTLWGINSKDSRSAFDKAIAGEVANPSTAMADHDESVSLLKEFIETSIKKPGDVYGKYYHPESYILGSDIMKTVVIPNDTDKAWKFVSVEMVFEALNPETNEKEEFLKVVTEFKAIARISMLNDFAYSIEEEAYKITFYLAQYNGNWLIYDMSEPEFPVMTLDNAVAEYERIAQNVQNTNINQFIKELKKYKEAGY
ncbi:MAG TPA: hypothetical protein VKY45_06830 [Marinilabiliaceae bacterium]|nr:hypothetical protein [Marinilabiliaceae bacterium]